MALSGWVLAAFGTLGLLFVIVFNLLPAMGVTTVPVVGTIERDPNAIVKALLWAIMPLIGFAFGISAIVARNQILYGARSWTWLMLLGFPGFVILLGILGVTVDALA